MNAACPGVPIVITGPPTHSVGSQTSNSRWRLSSSVVVCNTPWRACRRLHPRSPGDHAASSLIIAPRLHGGPVVLRPVRATPCYVKVLCPTQPKVIYRRRSSQPISWLSTEKLKYNKRKRASSVTKYNLTQKQTQKH